ncbi:hypothetical protein PVAG01_08318 [Phlyctema vagabunda]|uniref:Uncharacterized protein n=1 Tax=Phlyctema vagabunda TaxID=108571 RepID=A0ABR4P962_9HELO
MYSKATLIAILAAVAEARFGQEQTPIAAISAVTSGGGPGVAATIAGGAISNLLAAANPCDKLKTGDKILAELGEGADAVAAARGMVGAEQNFNPFVVSVPVICNDPTLPVNPLLRGVVPLVDPAVGGSDAENANAATSLTTPFPADGLSVADIMAAQGFSNFTTKAADGTVGAAPAAGASSGSVASSAAVSEAPAATTAAAATDAANNDACVVSTTMVTVTRAAAAATSAAAVSATASEAASSATEAATVGSGAGSVSDPVTGTFEGFVASSIAGLDFGSCVPTMKFEAGLNGRKETENTFQAIDPTVNKGQQEALNPNIITNRIKDQLSNVCGANQAAKDAAVKAQADILALGTRDVTTADTWNSALGFAGANTNPDNAPQTGLVGHT